MKKYAAIASLLLVGLVIFLTWWYLTRSPGSSPSASPTPSPEVPRETQIPEPKKVTYTVKRGDYLLKIAREQLKDESKWTQIAELNNLKAPYILHAGRELVLTQDDATAGQSTSPIPLDEVAKHSTNEDCWMVIEDKVYDITSFIPRHPGGKVIALWCGKDATAVFNMRPGGRGSHSDRARSMLERYYKADLAQ